MNIQNVIVHSLQKDRYQASASIQLRDNELSVEPKISSLIARIADLYYKRSGRAYGNFGPTHFSAPLKACLDDATLFVPFTKAAMSTLSNEIVKAQLATGGYVLFAMFEQFNQRQFMVVMLKDTEGVSFVVLLESGTTCKVGIGEAEWRRSDRKRAALRRKRPSS